MILIIILKNTKGFFWGVQEQQSIEKTHDASATAEPKGTASALLFKCVFQHLGVPREELHDMTEELSLQTVH